MTNYYFIEMSAVNTFGYRAIKSKFDLNQHLALVTQHHELLIWTRDTICNVANNVQNVPATQDYTFYQTLNGQVYYILNRTIKNGILDHVLLSDNARKIVAGRDCCALITNDNTLYLTGENNVQQFPSVVADVMEHKDDDDGRIEPFRLVETKQEFILPLKIADNVRDVSCGYLNSLILVFND